MDIHSGGIDLAFPHHDNEMAQSEVLCVNLTRMALFDNSSGVPQLRLLGELFYSHWSPSY